MRVLAWGLLHLAFFLSLIPTAAAAQTASLRGRVTDQTGAIVPGASVLLTNPRGQIFRATSGADGSYAFTGLAPGPYKAQASAANLTQAPVAIQLKPGLQNLPLVLQVLAAQQQITVNANAGPTLSTESAGNASALVLQGNTLNALADDPEDLATDLQALAGPSAGPEGSSVFIDGFTGGELPPKDAIQSIRINQDPFSPEYDTLGYGRVEILTKPGATHLHGGGYFNIGDSIWNSRNPYAAQKAPFLLREYGATVDGPLRKSTSYFLALDGADIANGAVINGSTLDPATLAIIDPYTQVFTMPQQRIRVSGRIDDQLASKDTVSLRYMIADANIRHSGIGAFNLDTTGVHNRGTDQSVQVSNALTLGENAVNETRFQYYRAHIANTSESIAPQLQVLNAFTGGGAQVGNASSLLNTWEFQNYVTLQHGHHTLDMGVRVRAQTIGNTSPIDFGGTFTFGGRAAPELDSNNQPVLNSSGQPVITTINSIEAYRRTLLFQSEGKTPSQVRALGGGASQFTLNAGQPRLGVDQEDIGVFAGDTWQARPNLTLDYGLRYEWQTNMHDFRDVGPRLGFAWAPTFGRPASSPRTVVRAGFGIFYQRLDITNVLTAERYNGITQQSFVVTNPGFYPAIPPPSSLSSTQSQQSIEELSPKLRAPYTMDSALSVEQQLPAHTTVALTYVNSHGLHQFLSNDLNAPLPGTWNPQNPGGAVYPMGTANPAFLVESEGLYNQNELVTNVNAQVNSSVSLFGSYVFNHAMSNTDYSPPPQNTNFNPAIAIQGLGVGTFPANPYNFAGEYGPAATDIRHQVNFGGMFQTWGGLRWSPLFVAQSGAPFNITVGQDIFGTTLFNGRPGIATDTTRPGLVRSPYGLLDPNPIAGETILRRNAGRGPSIFMLNLRLSRVFGFGPAAAGSVSAGGGRSGTGPFGSKSQNVVKTGHRYSLSISAAVRNLLNHNNPGPIIGNITSPLFGQANQPYGATSLGGTGFSESADNRRLEFQTRLSF
ncbi:MAG: carboxypeptidase regulatory-like domain-containing protein [Acidobacteriota bacterium]